MIKLTGGNGSSKEQAIIILNAKTEREGVDAEYELVSKYFGIEDIDWRLVEQYLISSDATERYYDILRIEDRAGKQYEIYFDITDFIGK